MTWLDSSLSQRTPSVELPSIFTLIAADGLRNTIQPAFAYLSRILAEWYPDKFGKLHGLRQEVFLVFDLALQTHYLTEYDALFSEHFYGLRRKASSGRRSSDHLALKSVTLSVLLPYIKAKLDQLFLYWRDRAETEYSPRDSWTERVRPFFLAVYPSIHFLSECSTLLCYLLYSLGLVDFHVASNGLAGVRVENLTAQDMSDIQARTALADRTLVEKVLSSGMRRVAAGLTFSLEVGAFFLQFLESWYAREGQTATLTSLPVPSNPEEDLGPSSELAGKCPICRGRRKNETLLITSGFVFCFKCIMLHLRHEGHFCPVIKYPSDEDCLIRIYGQNLQ